MTGVPELRDAWKQIRALAANPSLFFGGGERLDKRVIGALREAIDSDGLLIVAYQRITDLYFKTDR